MSYPAIVPVPQYNWCPSCRTLWTPAMIAVGFLTDLGTVSICGECVAQAAAMVVDEQKRRADDERARRQS